MAPYKILKTEEEYNEVLDRTIDLFDAEPGTPEFDELELLLLLVKDYEDRHYQIPYPDPIAAIKLKLKEMGLKNKDLIPIIGSEGHVSAVLSGKRSITLDMARGIRKFLGIPADVLLGAG